MFDNADLWVYIDLAPFVQYVAEYGKEKTMSYICRAITRDGSARIIFTDSTDIVKAATEIHHTSKTMTAVLGRALTAASLMGSLLKDKDNSLTLQIKGDGPAGTIICVSDYSGNVRGCADDPTVELPPNSAGKLNVGGAVGMGSLYVIKDMGMNDPYVGVSELVSGEIGDDITEYFAASEQTPSVCALGVRVDTEKHCTAAGGYLLQLLPGADESMIPIIEENVGRMDSVSSLVFAGKTGEEIIAQVFEGIEYDMFDEFDTDYVCTCSRERYLTALAGLSDKDMDDLRDGKPIEAQCHFCGKKYSFSVEEIDAKRNEDKK